MPILRNDYTDQYTIKSGHLDVGHGHKIYYEQWGNKQSKVPVVFFHGGPGAHYKAAYKNSFDPKFQQVIFFDQRGCGNSFPYGRIEHNTTQDLIADTKKLLDHLHIKKVNLLGGSWGSTVALLFNIAYPDIVKNTIIRGVFLGSQDQIAYVDSGHFKTFYPEVWARFIASVPERYRSSPAAYHYKMLHSNDKKKVIASSKALSDLETPLLRFEWKGYTMLQPKTKDEDFDHVPYLIYGHYLSHKCFLPENYIMSNVNSIHNPVYIVHGRYDMVCPIITAYELDKSLQNSKLYITHASHGNDPENAMATKILIDHVF